VVGSVYRVQHWAVELNFAPCLTASPDRGGIGAQSNVVNGQKLHADTLKDALNGIDGCRIWGLSFELKIIDSALANRSGVRQLTNRPGKQGACGTALSTGNHNSVGSFHLPVGGRGPRIGAFWKPVTRR